MGYGKFIYLMSIEKVVKFNNCLQVQQQIAKEYQKIKEIQKELIEMTMDLQNIPIASKFRAPIVAEEPAKDPASWFHPDPDIWTPPAKDPDVWGPPIRVDQR